MTKRRLDPRSTTDRLHALRTILPDMIDERPADPALGDFMRRAADSLFADVTDLEERRQCLKMFAEIGLALGVPATLVRDALDLADAPAKPGAGR